MLTIAASSEFEDVPNEKEIEHEFSKSFDKKTKKIIKNSQSTFKNSKTLKRVAAIFTASLVILSASTIQIDSLETMFYSFFVNDYGEYSEIDWSGEPSVIEKFIEEETYIPTYITQGYEIDLFDSGMFDTIILFRDEYKNTITFHQKVLGGGKSNYNTEDAELRKTYVFEKEALIVERDDELIYLVFRHDGFEFAIAGIISEEELIKMAESIELVNIQEYKQANGFD
ncbi:MAG: DUF4367 domain-containing protein [Clostridia bacterium]